MNSSCNHIIWDVLRKFHESISFQWKNECHSSVYFTHEHTKISFWQNKRNSFVGRFACMCNAHEKREWTFVCTFQLNFTNIWLYEKKTSGINLANTLLQSKWLLPWITFWLNPWKTLKTLNGLSINLNVCNFNGFSIQWGFFVHVLTSNWLPFMVDLFSLFFFHIIRCSCHHHSWGIKSKKKSTSH